MSDPFTHDPIKVLVYVLEYSTGSNLNQSIQTLQKQWNKFNPTPNYT